MHLRPYRNHSGTEDAHSAQPAFHHLDANAAVSDRQASHHGSAQFLSATQLLDLPLLSQPDPKRSGFVDLAGEVMGDTPRDPTCPVFLNGAGLTLTFGAPGGGKSTQLSTQLLRPRTDSFIVLDLKGELHARCAPYLSQHMDVKQHGLFFGGGANFNPLKAIPRPPAGSALRAEDIVRVQTELYNLANDVIEATLEQPFWPNSERSLFITLAGYVWVAALAPDASVRQSQPWRVRVRTMAEVYRLLNLVGEDRKQLVLNGLQRCALPFVRDGAKEWLALMAARETYAAVQSDLLSQLRPWAHPVIEHSSRQCDYTFGDLRRRPTAVFLRLPPSQIKYCRAWLRAYFGTAMRHLMYDTRGCAVSIYLDEAALLGTMESFDQVIGAIRGYRIRLNAFYQSLGQLKAGYPDTWETWLSTAFAKTYFSINDVDTADWISRSIGDTTIAIPSFQIGEARATTRGTATGEAVGKNTFQNSSIGYSESVQRQTDVHDPPFFGSYHTGKDQGSLSATLNAGEGFGHGESTQRSVSENESSTSTGNAGTQWTYTKRRLLDATEVMTLPEGLQIIQTAMGPILARMVRYFDNPVLLKRASQAGDDALPSPTFGLPE